MNTEDGNIPTADTASALGDKLFELRAKLRQFTSHLEEDTQVQYLWFLSDF